MIKDLHARAERRLFMDDIAIYLFERLGSEKIAMMTDVTMETLEIGQFRPETPLVINLTTAQELIDSLWECGLRPSEGSGSAGSLKSTENHLKDMQTLSWRLLGMIEKRG